MGIHGKMAFCSSTEVRPTRGCEAIEHLRWVGIVLEEHEKRLATVAVCHWPYRRHRLTAQRQGKDGGHVEVGVICSLHCTLIVIKDGAENLRMAKK